MSKRAKGIDPAAYELISFINHSEVDIESLRAWEKQYLSGYVCFGASRKSSHRKRKTGSLQAGATS